MSVLKECRVRGRSSLKGSDATVDRCPSVGGAAPLGLRPTARAGVPLY